MKLFLVALTIIITLLSVATFAQEVPRKLDVTWGTMNQDFKNIHFSFNIPLDYFSKTMNSYILDSTMTGFEIQGDEIDVKCESFTRLSTGKEEHAESVKNFKKNGSITVDCPAFTHTTDSENSRTISVYINVKSIQTPSVKVSLACSEHPTMKIVDENEYKKDKMEVSLVNNFSYELKKNSTTEKTDHSEDFTFSFTNFSSTNLPSPLKSFMIGELSAFSYKLVQRAGATKPLCTINKKAFEADISKGFLEIPVTELTKLTQSTQNADKDDKKGKDFTIECPAAGFAPGLVHKPVFIALWTAEDNTKYVVEGVKKSENKSGGGGSAGKVIAGLLIAVALIAAIGGAIYFLVIKKDSGDEVQPTTLNGAEDYDRLA